MLFEKDWELTALKRNCERTCATVVNVDPIIALAASEQKVEAQTMPMDSVYLRIPLFCARRRCLISLIPSQHW